MSNKDYADLVQIKRIINRVNAKAGFNPNQPRVPSGNADGGEWTDTGGGTPSARSPRIGEPSKPSVWQQLFGTRPAHGMTNERPDKNPLSVFLEGGGVGRGGGGGRSGGRVSPPPAKPVSAPREQEYLREARKIPEGVREVSRGPHDLTHGQKQSLKKFGKKLRLQITLTEEQYILSGSRRATFQARMLYGRSR